MKYIKPIAIITLILVSFADADLPYNEPAPAKCCLYVEELSSGDESRSVCAFLEMNPFLENDTETGFSYYIVHTDKAKQKILNAFLPRLRKHHKHSKLPFTTVMDYWEEVFEVPFQIFVFGESDEHKEIFYTSPICEKIIATARILDLGFTGNGAISIAEEEIKDFLDVPAEYKLITTIFINRLESQKVSRVQP